MSDRPEWTSIDIDGVEMRMFVDEIEGRTVVVAHPPGMPPLLADSTYPVERTVEFLGVLTAISASDSALSELAASTDDGDQITIEGPSPDNDATAALAFAAPLVAIALFIVLGIAIYKRFEQD